MHTLHVLTYKGKMEFVDLIHYYFLLTLFSCSLQSIDLMLSKFIEQLLEVLMI